MLGIPLLSSNWQFHIKRDIEGDGWLIQWSHSLSAMERSVEQRLPVGPRCFNEAIA